MAYLIGVDEAGYGPNLGPLTIAASVWQIDEEVWQDLFDRCSPVISRPGEQTPETWVFGR